MTSFFIIKFDDIRATTRFDTSIEIVIVESATNNVVTNNVVTNSVVTNSVVTNNVVTNNVITANAIASNAIANAVTILLKTRLI